MEQGAPALQRLGGRALHHPGGVLEHIVYMVLRHLGASLHGHKLRQHEGQYIDAGHKRIVNVVAADEALQLTVDALAGHFPQEALAGDHSVEGGRVDGHAELGGEATGSQDAQCIFGKTRRRIAHAAQHAALHVVQAVEGVDDPARGMVGQGVYGEVPPLQILFYRGSRSHGVGMAPVAVNAVGAVSGDLQRLAFACHGESAMGDAGFHGAPAGASERLLHRGPRQARRDVHIVDGSPEQSVANEAAHAPCLSSGLLDDFQSIMGDKRKGERLGKIAPNRFAGSKFVFTSSTASDRFVRLRRV